MERHGQQPQTQAVDHLEPVCSPTKQVDYLDAKPGYFKEPKTIKECTFVYDEFYRARGLKVYTCHYVL